MTSPRLLLGILLVCAAASACDSGRSDPPNVTVYSVNAAPSYLSVQFLREERPEPRDAPPLTYGEARRHSFDADEYDFNFEITPPNSTSLRVATLTETLSEQNTYYVIIAELGGIVDPVIVEEPTFDPQSQDSEISVYHADPTLGEVDVYVEAPGATLAAATPRGTLGFREPMPPETIPAGDYRVTLTAPGSPGDVLYRSPPFETAAGQDNMLVIADEAGLGLASARVLRVNTTPDVLEDAAAPAVLRAVNVAEDGAPRDVVLDGDYDSPLFAALPFGTPTDYAGIAVGAHDLTVTPPGNPGVIEVDHTFTARAGDYHTFLFTAGANEAFTALVAVDRYRRIDSTAVVRGIHGAPQLAQVDAVLASPGTALENGAGLFRISRGEVSQYTPRAPGEYDFGLIDVASGEVVAGPLPIQLDARGVYTIAVADGPDAGAEILLLDDFE